MYHSPFSVACFSPLRYYIATRSRVLGSRTLFARASSQPALPAGTSQYCDAGTLFLVDALHQPIYRLRSRDRLTCLRWPSRGKSNRSASVWRGGRCATSATAEKRRKPSRNACDSQARALSSLRQNVTRSSASAKKRQLLRSAGEREISRVSVYAPI